MVEEQLPASVEAGEEEVENESTARPLSPLVDFGSVLDEIAAAGEGKQAEALEEVALAEEQDIETEEEVSETAADGDEIAAEGTETKVADDEAAWFVIHCYSGYENKVKHNLEQRIDTMQMQDQIFAVEVPTEDEIEVREGKRRTVQRRIFPGYILVQMNMNDDSWYVVRNTPGVTGFVGMGNKPTPLRVEEVQGIMQRMEADAPKIKVTFRPGQKVRIIDGPFNDFMGVVEEIDIDRAKVRVFVSFFGRETPIELDFLQVEKM
jgi:transcriptional antiterminator NusG